MDAEFIKQMATDINNVVMATADPYQKRINALESKLAEIHQAATKWPRCCDLWQDSLGCMHCTECSQKTFAMFRSVQRILGVNKAGKPIGDNNDNTK